MLSRKLLTAAVLIVSGGVANAAMITVSGTSGDITTELIDEQVSYDQFNPANGTLTDVDITYTISADQDLTLTNNASGDATFRFNSNFEFFIDLLADQPGPFGSDTSAVMPTANTGGFITLASGESVNYMVSPTQVLATISIDPAEFTNYIGTGQVTDDCSTQFSSTFSGGGGNIAVDQTTTAVCSASVQYTFNEPQQPPVSAVPVPAALLLLLGGLLGARKRA